MARIFRFNAATALAGMEDSANQRRRIADALDESCNAPAALIHADGQHLDAIVVHQGRGIGSRQYQRRRAVIRYYQHIAVRTAANPPRDALAIARNRESVGSLDCLAIAHHGAQAFDERLTLRIGAHSQSLGEPRCAQRFRRLTQVLQQQFAARNRIGVARLFKF